MLGADVVKAEQPHGDPFRVLALGFLGWNQGKRSLAMNLLVGRPEVLRRLIAASDVVIENYRPYVARRLRLDDHAVRGFNPRIIHLGTTGFDEETPWAETSAFDGTVQALSGLAWEQGGGVEPVYHTVPVTDLMTPLLSTFGVCAALYHRERTGRGQRVRTSLARAALAAQAAECTRYEGTQHVRGGIDFAGPAASRRWYRCADGAAIVIDARTERERAALLAALDVPLTVDALSEPRAAPPPRRSRSSSRRGRRPSGPSDWQPRTSRPRRWSAATSCSTRRRSWPTSWPWRRRIRRGAAPRRRACSCAPRGHPQASRAPRRC